MINILVGREQHVWAVRPTTGYTNASEHTVELSRKISKSLDDFVSLRMFESRAECIDQLRAARFTIWTCDVTPTARPLLLPQNNVDAVAPPIVMPDRLALVMGEESFGVSDDMTRAAALAVYLPMVGFGSSVNVSVATALIVQRVLDLAPQYRGQMDERERSELRKNWFRKLAKHSPQRLEAFGRLAEMPTGAIVPLSDVSL